MASGSGASSHKATLIHPTTSLGRSSLTLTSTKGQVTPSVPLNSTMNSTLVSSQKPVTTHGTKSKGRHPKKPKPTKSASSKSSTAMSLNTASVNATASTHVKSSSKGLSVTSQTAISTSNPSSLKPTVPTPHPTSKNDSGTGILTGVPTSNATIIASQTAPGSASPTNGKSPGQQQPKGPHGLPAVGVDADFNFYDGTIYNVSDPSTSNTARRAEARAINNALPFDIQDAFNSGSITYYDPGSGSFYYVLHSTNGVPELVQVARSCNCYVSVVDKETHFLAFDPDKNVFDPSVFNAEALLPAATKSRVLSGDSLEQISDYYGVPLSMILSANPKIKNPDNIYPGQYINIPAQGYVVKAGDSFEAIAEGFNISFSALEGLNPQVQDPDFISPNEILKIPASNLKEPFVYTVQARDTLWNIASKHGISLSELEDENPQIVDKNLISVGQILKIPVYLPSQGSPVLKEKCESCGQDNGKKAMKGAKASGSPKMTTTTIQVGPTSKPIVATVPVTENGKSSKVRASFQGSTWKQ